MRAIVLVVLGFLLLLGGIVLPTLRTWRASGVWPIPTLRPSGPSNFVGMLLELAGVALAFGMIVEVLAYLAAPTVYDWLHPIPSLERTEFYVSGAVLALGSALLMMACQLGLGRSWRIGIDEETPGPLVSSGFYAFCRNPIFGCLVGVLAGFFLLLPNVLSAVFLVGTWLGVNVQVRHEEAFLSRRYGDEYFTYARRVGRFTRWTGR